MTNKIRLSLKLLISVGALVFAFHNTDLSQLTQVGVSVKWSLLLLAVCASIASVTLLGLRWQRILKPVVSAPLPLLIRGQYIGLFGNNVFPLRAGEFMRADFARKRLRKGFITIIATVFFERLLDLIMVPVVFAILITTTSKAYLPLNYDIYILIGVLLFGGFVVIVVQNRSRIITMLGNRFPSNVDNSEWLSELLTYRAIWSYLLLSTLVWSFYALRFQLVLTSIGQPVDIGLVVLLLVATAAGFLIPAAPGAIGTYHMAVVFSMHNLYGIDLITAQASSILLHLSAYVPSTLIGFIAFLGSAENIRDASIGK